MQECVPGALVLVEDRRLAALHEIAGHRGDDDIRMVLGADLIDHVLMSRMEGIVFGDDTDDFFSIDHCVLTARIRTLYSTLLPAEGGLGSPGHLS